MKNKQWIGVALVVVVAVIAAGVLAYTKMQEKKEADRQQQIELELKEYIESEIDRKFREEKAQQEMDELANMNVYDKLSDSQEVSILIIADFDYKLGNQNLQLGWYKNVQAQLSEKYGSRVLMTLMPASDNNVAWNWLLLNEYYLDKEYDAVILTCDMKNQMELSLTDFSRYYEGILRDVKGQKPVTDILTLVMNPDEDAELLKRAKLINDLFTGNIEDVSGMDTYMVVNSIEEINEEVVHQYYNTFTNKLLSMIDKNVLGRKKTKVEAYESTFMEFDYAEGTEFLLAPTAMEGFKKGNSSNMISVHQEDYLTYEVSGSHLYLTYQISPEGGKYGIYINDDFVKEVDTESLRNSSNTITLQNLYDRPVTLKIQTSDIGEDVSKQVSIFGVCQIQ